MSEPNRLCTACRRSLPKSSLIRIVNRDGELVIDVNHRMPGRGTYVCKDDNCIALAHKRHSVEKSLKLPVQEDIYTQLVDKS